MIKKTYLGLLAVFAVGLTGTVAFADVPDHVDLPNQPYDRATAFQPVIIQTDELTAVFVPMMTTFDDPDSHEFTQSNGGVLLDLFSSTAHWGCSGTLIADNKILTAGHCVANNNGDVDVEWGTAYFGNVQHTGNWDFSSPDEYDIVGAVAHNRYDGDYIKGFDIAIVTIDVSEGVPPSSIDRVELDEYDEDTVDQIVDIFGYGISGYGATGATSNYPFGTHRTGQNTIDAYADTMYSALGMKPNKDYKRGAVIQSDFDNGSDANDAFQEFFGIKHLGIGTEPNNPDPPFESKVCSGDSGGSIRNAAGEVTGVNSYSITLTWNTGGSSDVDSSLNCSFGEFTGYTNVPYHADWIKSELGGGTDDGGGNGDKDGKGQPCNPRKETCPP